MCSFFFWNPGAQRKYILSYLSLEQGIDQDSLPNRPKNKRESGQKWSYRTSRTLDLSEIFSSNQNFTTVKAPIESKLKRSIMDK